MSPLAIKAISAAAVLLGTVVLFVVHPFANSLFASRSAPPSVYWGAYIEGSQTYNYLYGGGWSDAPWCDPGTRCPLPTFEQNAGKQVSIEHWGMCWTCKFDPDAATNVVNRGDIPAVDWSTAGATDADVADGNDDAWLTAQAQAIKSFGHPIFLLFDEEMNGTWYPYSPGVNGNTAADFVAMWQHVHDIFTSVGATNVTWVWCPNVTAPDGTNESTPTALRDVYPGDAYVDWTGLNGYNWGGSDWQSFQSLGRPTINSSQIAPDKPIMIGETASARAAARRRTGSRMRSASSFQRASPASRPSSGSTGVSTRRAPGSRGRSSRPRRHNRHSHPRSVRRISRQVGASETCHASARSSLCRECNLAVCASSY